MTTCKYNSSYDDAPVWIRAKYLDKFILMTMFKIHRWICPDGMFHKPISFISHVHLNGYRKESDCLFWGGSNKCRVVLVSEGRKLQQPGDCTMALQSLRASDVVQIPSTSTIESMSPDPLRKSHLEGESDPPTARNSQEEWHMTHPFFLFFR